MLIRGNYKLRFWNFCVREKGTLRMCFNRHLFNKSLERWNLWQLMHRIVVFLSVVFFFTSLMLLIVDLTENHKKVKLVQNQLQLLAMKDVWRQRERKMKMIAHWVGAECFFLKGKEMICWMTERIRKLLCYSPKKNAIKWPERVSLKKLA